MQDKEGYKQTEIGLIPDDWNVNSLESLCLKILGGGTPSREDANFWQDGTIPWLTPSEFTGNNYRFIASSRENITEEGLKNSSAVLLPIGTVIMSSRATIGEVKINKTALTINQGFTSFVCGKELLNEFLEYWIKQNKNKLIQLSSGSTFLEIGKAALKKLKLPIPPLKEQQKIAEILSTVDAKLDVIDAEIEQTQTLKKGLMQTLLTQGIGHTQFKDSPLGQIPESWEVVKLDDIGSFLKGKGISKNEVLEEGFDCIRYGEIYTDYHFVANKLVSKINQKSADNSQEIFQGDVLFAGSGETIEEIGKSVAYESGNKAYASGDIVILRPEIKVVSAYLSYQLNSTQFGRKQLNRLGQGSSVMHIYSSSLSKVLMPVPTFEEQTKIANILSTVDDKIELLQQCKAEIKTLKKGLMQKLLTGEVRVRVA